MAENKKYLDEKDLDEVSGGARLTQGTTHTTTTTFMTQANAIKSTCGNLINENDGLRSPGNGNIGFTCARCNAKFVYPSFTGQAKYHHMCGANLTLYDTGICKEDGLGTATGGVL